MSSAWRELCAGCASGIASRIAVAPLDVIKIRLQIQDGHSVHRHTYRSLSSAVSSIVSHEGIFGLWHGNVPGNLLYMGFAPINFFVYHSVLTHLADSSLPAKIAASLAASSAATVATYPLDLLRTVFASQGVPKPYPTLSSAVSGLVRDSHAGYAALFRGLSPSLAQTVPYVSLQLVLYEQVKEIAWEHGAIPWWASALLGGSVGGLAKMVFYPLDVIRKRMQVQNIPRAPGYGGRPTSYSSSWHCARSILASAGPRGFYQGAVPTLIKVVPSSLITFLAYEQSLKLLNRLFPSDPDPDPY